jgi:hypothetical protein
VSPLIRMRVHSSLEIHSGVQCAQLLCKHGMRWEMGRYVFDVDEGGGLQTGIVLRTYLGAQTLLGGFGLSGLIGPFTGSGPSGHNSCVSSPSRSNPAAKHEEEPKGRGVLGE